MWAEGEIEVLGERLPGSIHEPEEGITFPESLKLPGLQLLPYGLMLPVPAFPAFVIRRKRERRAIHPGREAVCRTISENPGAALVELSTLTGMNRGTLKYHLIALEVEGRVVSVSRYGRSHFFPNNGRYSGQEKAALYHLRNPASRHLLLLLQHHPGLCRKEIADRIGISGPTVSWHMHRLLVDGVIDSRREGRTVHYYIAPCLGTLIPHFFEDLSCT